MDIYDMGKKKKIKKVSAMGKPFCKCMHTYL